METFSLVYDDDAANKFQLFCIYFSLLSFSCALKVGRDRQTMRSIKSSSTQEFRHQFPPFKNFLSLKMGNKKIISFYEFSFFLCNNRWWYWGRVRVTSRVLSYILFSSHRCSACIHFHDPTAFDVIFKPANPNFCALAPPLGAVHEVHTSEL